MRLRSGILGATCQNTFDFGGVLRHCGLPLSETTVLVDGFSPLVEESAFCSALVVDLTFGFENQHRPRFRTDQEIWTVFAYYPVKNVENLEAEMIVFDP